MDRVRSAPAQAPEVIPVVIPSGPANRGGNAPLSQVRGPEDLPNHLFVGEIEPGRFQRTSSGWEAFYFGIPEDTLLKLTYRSATRAGPALTTLEMYYRGVRGALAAYNGDDPHRLVQFAFPQGMPAEWHAPLSNALTSRYNVCVISGAASKEFVAYSPSGILFDLVVPVAIARLRDCVAMMRHVQSDGIRVAPVHAALRHVTSFASQREESAGGLGTPEAHFLRTWHATGLKPPRMPEWKAHVNGARVLHVARAHYVLEVHCFLVDVEHIIRCLAEAGIVGLRAEARGLAMADSPDYTAVARLYRPDRVRHGSAVLDAESGRRIDYLAPLPASSWAPEDVTEAGTGAALDELMGYVQACEDFERAACGAGPVLDSGNSRALEDQDTTEKVEIELDLHSQPLADALIEALGDETCLVKHSTLESFQGWCDEAGFFEGAIDVVCCGRYSIFAPEPEEVIYRAAESFAGRPTVPQILAQIRKTWEALAIDHEEWGEERPYRIAAPVRHSNGTLRTLGFVFSNSYSPIECDGIFADREAYEEWMAWNGLVPRERDLDRIPLSEVVESWSRS